MPPAFWIVSLAVLRGHALKMAGGGGDCRDGTLGCLMLGWVAAWSKCINRAKLGGDSMAGCLHAALRFHARPPWRPVIIPAAES